MIIDLYLGVAWYPVAVTMDNKSFFIGYFSVVRTVRKVLEKNSADLVSFYVFSTALSPPRKMKKANYVSTFFKLVTF